MVTRKPWEPVEARLIAEWAASTYPDNEKLFRLRLGAGPITLEQSGLTIEQWRASTGLFRRYADLLVVFSDHLMLVEGKVIAAPVAIGELELYARLLPSTPELMGIARLPLELRIVCARPDPAVTALAREKGIAVETFDPPWVSEYLTARAARQRGQGRLDAALIPNDSAGGPAPATT